MSISAGSPRQTRAVAPVAAAPAQTSAQAQAARLLGVAPAPAKPAAPQPVATPQQSLLGLLTAKPAPKPAAQPAATSKAPNKTTASLLTPKPATAAKKPAGKTNR
jgi:DamX protein